MKAGAIWMELHALHKHGWTISALAREFGLNWRTVKRELESGEPRRYAARSGATAAGLDWQSAMWSARAGYWSAFARLKSPGWWTC